MSRINALKMLVESVVGLMLALPGILIGSLGVMLMLSGLSDFDFLAIIVGIVFVGLGLGWINWTIGNLKGIRRIGT